jgi:protein-S-isoprenylcysteine O-methyltransferase Ste14
MEGAAFAATLLASTWLLAGVCWSIARPDRRYWPPERRDWRYWTHWGADVIARGGLFVIAYLDYGTLGWPQAPTLGIGAILFVTGAATGVAAERRLGTEETMGLTGQLRTDGLYRYSRNPQYVGAVVATVGLLLLANSRLLAVLAAVQLCHWLALPLSEEPWLTDQYGDAYRRYRSEVPRFVGLVTVRRVATAVRACAVRE